MTGAAMAGRVTFATLCRLSVSGEFPKLAAVPVGTVPKALASTPLALGRASGAPRRVDGRSASNEVADAEADAIVAVVLSRPLVTEVRSIGICPAICVKV